MVCLYLKIPENFIIIIIIIIILHCVSFSQWCLSDGRPSQVSRTHLSILADLNNAVVWWSLFVFKFPTLPVLSLSLWGLFQVLQIQLVSPSPPSSTAFLVLWQGPSTCLLFCFLWLFFFIYSLRVFHISVSWWSFTGVWVTASLLRSPGLFSILWLFSIM